METCRFNEAPLLTPEEKEKKPKLSLTVQRMRLEKSQSKPLGYKKNPSNPFA
jgi:hypothetical protein